MRRRYRKTYGRRSSFRSRFTRRRSTRRGSVRRRRRTGMRLRKIGYRM
jgi:hypothetical protein